MAFEQVYLRTTDGQQYGPVTYKELVQWHQQGRVPPNAFIVDAVSGEAQPISAFPALAVPPPPMPGAPGMPPTSVQQPPSAINQMIPTQNPQALWAYYLGIFSLICCIFPLPSLGPAALVLGILGLRNVERSGVGKGHAITGIVIGSLVTLENIAAIVLLIIYGSTMP
jgi:hypothetical protein